MSDEPPAQPVADPGDLDASIVWYVVEANYAGWTLAAYVTEKMKRPPEGERLEKMLRGRALVHSEPEGLLPDSQLRPGLRFGLRRRFPGDLEEAPPLTLIHDDDALLIVDKPAGVAIHPTARYFKSTLTYALETRHRDAQGNKPDPAHRLDRETSGLVACGRTSLHTRALKAAFAARQVDKAYLALCEGDAREDSFEIDLPLKVGSPRIKVKVLVDPLGAVSQTSCTVVQRYLDPFGRPLTLVRCVPRTGRQHQLRVHLSAVGLPLVGDKIYGPSEEIFLKLAERGTGPAPRGQFDACLSDDDRAALRLWRHALHASELTVPHPATGERLSFTAPLPADLAELLATFSASPAR